MQYQEEEKEEVISTGSVHSKPSLILTIVTSTENNKTVTSLLI
jgi:hypothetical protein